MTERGPRPLMIERGIKGQVHPLRRIPLGQPPFSERELQDILEERPELLPVEQMDPIFGPPVCIGREVSTGSGSLDLLYTSPNGYLTLVETKLWRNPEARREVVAQIIDYCNNLTRWDYIRLESVFREYAKRGEADRGDLCAYVGDKAEEELDETEFADAVGRCLSQGRFLLLIVGDGIRENIQHMASYLQSAPSLQFTLGLVEIGCFHAPTAGSDPLILVPRIVARTAEIERAVVRIEAAEELAKLLRLSTATPPPGPDGGERKPLSKKEFYDQLAKSSGQRASEQTEAFIDHIVQQHGLLHEHYTPRGLSLKFERPNTDLPLRALFRIVVSGKVYTNTGVLKALVKAGYPKELAWEFYQRLAEIDPALGPTEKPGGGITFQHGKSKTVPELLAHFPAIQDAVLTFIQGLERASEDIAE